MIADNRERKLTTCKEIVDGEWSEWTDLEECIYVQAGNTCGPGYKKQRRNCDRTLGGRFCKDEGADYKAGFMLQIIDCDSKPCSCDGKLFCNRTFISI